MSRLEILLAFSKFLQGVARPARLLSSDVQYSMILYARELVRHKMKQTRPFFEKVVQNNLDSDVQVMGNAILIKLDKEKKRGGKLLKSQIAECVLNNRIIEKSLLKKYKRYFKCSKLTFSNLRYYDHALMLATVVRGFINSLTPEKEIKERTIFLDLATNKIVDLGMGKVSFRDQANHYIAAELEQIGMKMDDETCLNLSEVSYFHYSIIPGTSFEFHLPRIGLLPYLTGKEINPLQTIISTTSLS